MPSDTIIGLALACITVLEAIALCKGIDGVLLTTVIGVIAGIAGYKFNEVVQSRKVDVELEPFSKSP